MIFTFVKKISSKISPLGDISVTTVLEMKVEKQRITSDISCESVLPSHRFAYSAMFIDDIIDDKSVEQILTCNMVNIS